MGIKIKNLRGTSDNGCACPSWIAHWTKHAGRGANFCYVAGCQEKKDLVGAHVQTSTSSDWFIVPMCKAHNADTGVMEVEDYTPFVSANVAKTCG